MYVGSVYKLCTMSTCTVSTDCTQINAYAHSVYKLCIVPTCMHVYVYAYRRIHREYAAYPLHIHICVCVYTYMKNPYLDMAVYVYMHTCIHIYLSGTFITCQRGANSCFFRVFSIFCPKHQIFIL